MCLTLLARSEKETQTQCLEMMGRRLTAAADDPSLNQHRVNVTRFDVALFCQYITQWLPIGHWSPF